ncbi:MAG: hypothetical protein K0R54_3955 [Clostridiaceae bacterium]|jgi:hypothetical protein|nr:hypothetical protein [Clostridiaceae bacterium]
MEQTNYYILFPSHTEGMKLEEKLKASGIKHTISPTPRELTTCCGISIIYNLEDEDKIKNIISDNHINIIGMRSLTKKYANFYK